MRLYIYDDPLRVSRWVDRRIPGEQFDPSCTAIGAEEDGELIGGVVYTHYAGTDVRMHVAGEPGKNWLTREFLYHAFAYPFLQLRCRRVSGLVRIDNFKAQHFDERLGFRREGLLREADDDGCDLIVYGMLRRECRWLGDKNKNG